MIDLLVGVLGQLVRSLIDLAIAVIAVPPSPQTATKVPTSSELRAFFESRNAGQPPADWLTRVQVAARPSMHGGYASTPTAPIPPAAPTPLTTQQTPSFVEAERETNPNFGIAPPAPRPVERTWENLPPSPARTGTVDVTAFHALHLEESARAEQPAPPTPTEEVRPAPSVTPAATVEALPLSPARTGTVNAQEFEALHLSETAHVSATPHPWDTLPLSPVRFGATAPAQLTATQPAAMQPGATQPVTAHTAVQQPSSAEPEIAERQPDWPELPQWPPPSVQPSPSPRAALRDGVDASWYV
jgi:hypothetical protein